MKNMRMDRESLCEKKDRFFCLFSEAGPGPAGLAGLAEAGVEAGHSVLVVLLLLVVPGRRLARHLADAAGEDLVALAPPLQLLLLGPFRLLQLHRQDPHTQKKTRSGSPDPMGPNSPG